MDGTRAWKDCGHWKIFQRTSTGWAFLLKIPGEKDKKTMCWSEVQEQVHTMTLRSVYYTAAGCWMVIPAVLQTNSHQHRQNKLLAFICCTQQQDHPNLLQGMFNRKVWGEVLESVLKLCLRHRATWEVTTSERHQLWSHQDVGTV